MSNIGKILLALILVLSLSFTAMPESLVHTSRSSMRLYSAC